MSNDNNNNNSSLFIKSNLSQSTIDKITEIGKIGINFNKSVNDFIPQVAKTLSGAIAPAVNFNKQFASTAKILTESIAPLVNYIYENKDRIENFDNSLKTLEDYYNQLKGISKDEAVDLIDKLIDEGKIIINENWSLEIVTEQSEVIDKTETKTTLSDIINIIGIAVSLSSGIPDINIDNSENYIDNSVTNIENYEKHETYIIQTTNDYIVAKDTNLYYKPNLDSNIMEELKVDDEIKLTSLEDDWAIVTIVIDDVTTSGWLKVDNIKPLIQLDK